MATSSSATCATGCRAEPRRREGLRINALRAYILILLALTVVWLVSALSALEAVTGTEIALALFFVVWIAVANRFPIHWVFRSHIVLDTAAIYAVALTFQPGLAMLIVLTGALLGSALRPRDIEEVAFNISQATLQAGAATGMLALIGWSGLGAAFRFPADLLSLTLAALVVFLTNTWLVSIVIGLHSNSNPIPIWLQSTTRHDALEQLTQFVLGLLAAIIAQQQAWALPLLGIPMLLVYTSLVRQYRLRHQTVEAVEKLADLIDLRDPYTANHSRRVAGYARLMATDLDLDPAEIEVIERAARVHDLGKLVIDVSVLAKSGKLTSEEWALFEQHPVTGVEVLRLFPDFAAGVALVRSHHERLDGKGYPDGLSGAAIPLGARIIAVADSFDAMASDRPYRKALAPELVLAELQRGRGSQWDAAVVDALLALIAQGRIALDAEAGSPVIRDTAGQPQALERPVA